MTTGYTLKKNNNTIILQKQKMTWDTILKVIREVNVPSEGIIIVAKVGIRKDQGHIKLKHNIDHYTYSTPTPPKKTPNITE